MPEEWVCDGCGYVGTGDGTCPECGNKLVSVGDYDDDLAKAGSDKYSKDEIKANAMDDEIDFVEDDEDGDEVESDKA